MSISQVTNSSPPWSISFSILDLKAQAVRLPVSKGAQILLSELLTWSGERGYCWWGKPAIARDLNWSVFEVWRRATELKRAGLLEVVPRPGRSNYWVPLPGRNKIQRLQKELGPLAESRGPLEKKNETEKKRCTVPYLSTGTEQPPSPPEPENVNAVKVSSPDMFPISSTTPQTPIAEEPVSEVRTPSRPEPISHHPMPSTIAPKCETRSPLTQDHLVLVEEIERVTGDTWSRGHFINLVRHVDEQTVYAALSVTREKMALESGVNGGAYFTATLKGMMGLSCLSPSPKNPEPSSDDRLRTLEHVYPHLRIHELFHRYVELKTEGSGGNPGDWLVSYEKFLSLHHEEIYTTKPVYRREGMAVCDAEAGPPMRSKAAGV